MVARSASLRNGNSTLVPLLASVTQSPPGYETRERQEFKEEGKPQVSLPFCPGTGQAQRSRAPQSANLPPPAGGEIPARIGRIAHALRVPRLVGMERCPI